MGIWRKIKDTICGILGIKKKQYGGAAITTKEMTFYLEQCYLPRIKETLSSEASLPFDRKDIQWVE